MKKPADWIDRQQKEQDLGDVATLVKKTKADDFL